MGFASSLLLMEEESVLELAWLVLMALAEVELVRDRVGAVVTIVREAEGAGSLSWLGCEEEEEDEKEEAC